MNNTNTITAIAVILLTFLLPGCGLITSTKPTTAEIYILVDITDSLPVQIKAEPILKNAGLETDIWQGITVQISTIEDVTNTPVTTFTLPGENELLGNIHARRSKLSAFTKEIDHFLSSLAEGGTVPKPRSCVFTKIVTTLSRLSKSPSTSPTTKRVYIYSDLMEFSEVDFYESQTLKNLQKDPASITSQLLNGQKIPDLSGMEIYLCYRPKDYIAGQTYNIVTDYYTRLFQENGATVILSAGTQTQTF